MRILLVGAIIVLLGGCSAQNTNMSTLQFSNAATPFPDDYRSRAAVALKGQVGAEIPLQISRPEPTVGASAFGPQRWYVCVRGVPGSAPAAAKKPVWHLAEEWLDPAARREELVLFYNATGLPAIRKSDGSPLCNGAEFASFTLAEAAATGRNF